MEERDQLAAQLAKKMETKVKVYHCTVCKKKTRFIDRDTCGAHMHAVKLVDATMRYFKCKACNQTNTPYDAFMPTRCERNGCTSVVFDRVSAADVMAAAKPRKDEMIAAEAAAGGQVASRDAPRRGASNTDFDSTRFTDRRRLCSFRNRNEWYKYLRTH